MQHMKKEKTIVFDFDGVIHDTYELCYQLNIKVSGKDLTREQHRDFFNGNLFEKVVIDAKKEKAESEQYYKLQNEAYKQLKIDENIKINLEKMSEKYSLFIISSNQEEALDNYFQNNKFGHIFKEMLGAETHKSKVEKFKYLFEKYNLKPKDCIFITDTLEISWKEIRLALGQLPWILAFTKEIDWKKESHSK